MGAIEREGETVAGMPVLPNKRRRVYLVGGLYKGPTAVYGYRLKTHKRY